MDVCICCKNTIHVDENIRRFYYNNIMLCLCKFCFNKVFSYEKINTELLENIIKTENVH